MKRHIIYPHAIFAAKILDCEPASQFMITAQEEKFNENQ